MVGICFINLCTGFYSVVIRYAISLECLYVATIWSCISFWNTRNKSPFCSSRFPSVDSTSMFPLKRAVVSCPGFPRPRLRLTDTLCPGVWFAWSFLFPSTLLLPPADVSPATVIIFVVKKTGYSWPTRLYNRLLTCSSRGYLVFVDDLSFSSVWYFCYVLDDFWSIRTTFSLFLTRPFRSFSNPAVLKTSALLPNFSVTPDLNNVVRLTMDGATSAGSSRFLFLFIYRTTVSVCFWYLPVLFCQWGLSSPFSVSLLLGWSPVLVVCSTHLVFLSLCRQVFHTSTIK